jgi:uncharacterized membrane protein
LQTDAATRSADPAPMPSTRPDGPWPPNASSGEESGQIGENIAAVHEFYAREELKRSASQRHAERIGGFVGRPAFLIGILLFVAAWMLGNEALGVLGLPVFDPPPFGWLQGMIALASLLATTVVLIKQNRVDRLSEQRAHLDLKVTLLIEQKTAKLIDLMEELRRDLPNVKNRVDSGASHMQNAMSPAAVLTALDEEVRALDGSISASTAPVAEADRLTPEGGAGG